MSTKTSNSALLIELGTEELPPKALRALSDAFTSEFVQSLTEAQVVDAKANVTSYAAPRRLAVLIDSVANGQPDQLVDRRGPAVQAAFKDGKPTPAAQGFAKSCGVEVDQLERLKTDKGEWLSYQITEKGRSVTELVQEALDTAIKRLPIPKRMRWGAKEVEFVRPAKWLVALYADDVLPVKCLDLTADRFSRGHRFHSTDLVEHKSALAYADELLKSGSVVANFVQRQALIKEQITKLVSTVKGHLVDDPALLDEVTGLVEKPRAVLGKFDEGFLDVPQECLVSSMRDHQKYFHVVDAKGQLMPYFITVSNIESKDEARMIDGNERVLRARLADAEFFWKSDQKLSLEDRVTKLDSVLFHVKLGTVLQKSQRIQTLSALLAQKLGAKESIAQRAALLCKADLVSNMVGEFDELQGVMGHYYADRDGEDSLVGASIEQHYWPRFAGDQLPESLEAQAVSLADKLDSLVGIYAAGEIPTGDKDPYGLRRTALSILRILIEQNHALSLRDLVADSSRIYAEQQDMQIDSATQEAIVAYIRGRLTAYYQAQDIPTTAINAVAACEPNEPLDFENRLKAVNAFSLLDEAQDLAAANKRIGNILKKQDGSINAAVDTALLEKGAEQDLYQAIHTIEAKCNSLFDEGNYADGLQLLASLRSPVDAFFENVMVMSENQALQNNRLALLKSMQDLFLRVADISLLQS